MIRRNGLLIAGLLATIGLAPHTLAQQGATTKPGEKPAVSEPQAKSAGTSAKPTAPQASAVMQIKPELQGDFSYRFLSKTDESAAPSPLPAPSNGIVALPVPATFKPGEAQLEILDNGRGNLARLPVATTGVTSLPESGFKFAQAVYVPVQSAGKGVYNAQVTLSSKTFGKKSWLLKEADGGMARFDNVPLDEPITASVSAGTNSKSVTETLTRSGSGTGRKMQPISVDWPEIKTVAAPAVAASGAPATSTASGGTTSTIPLPPATDPRLSQPASGGSPFSSFLSTLISLIFLGGIGYGLFWAYNNGKFKTLFEKLGIQTGALAPDGPAAPNPFTKPEKAPITPITEGTADPFAGGVAAGAPAAYGSAPPVVGSGPRLVATMGTYAGNIFPLQGANSDIGRDAGNAVPLPNDTNASRRHATIQINAGQVLLTDNGSSNGTFLNGVRVAAQSPQPLRPGDEVQIGMTRFRFEA